MDHLDKHGPIRINITFAYYKVKETFFQTHGNFVQQKVRNDIPVSGEKGPMVYASSSKEWKLEIVISKYFFFNPETFMQLLNRDISISFPALK